MKKLLVRVAAVLIMMAAARGWAQTFQTIHTFPADGSAGSKPWGTLTIGPDRNLYGTASEGGADGFGTAFRITPAGTFTVLGNFELAETGKAPKARLVNVGDGFLYGASSLGAGGGTPSGTVFRLDPAGGPTAAGGLTKLFAMPGSGSTPMVPFALTAGELGALHVLGSSPGGIWRVPLDGGLSTVAFTFPTSGDDGQEPQAIRRGSDGYLYGVTKGTSATDGIPGRRGTVFRILPNGTDFSTLHDCLSATGVSPVGGLAEGPNNTFYGTMSGGGTHLDGVIFRITASGEYTVLHYINDHNPLGDLLLASDGRLYGTSSAGGANLFGSVFRINTNGTGFQVIHNFNKTNGAHPKAGLVQADDGNLYGVTSEGGANNKGTIFRIGLNLPVPVVNRPPVAVVDQANTTGSPVNIRVLANDFDADDDALIVSIDTPPSHGTAVVETDGSITYSPTLDDYAGFDEFRYKITDPDGLSSMAIVTISAEGFVPPWLPGVYNGILYLDPALQGNQDTARAQLAIRVTDTGLFTGKLFTQKKRLTVRGFFDEDGLGIAVVKIPRQGKAVILLASGEGGALTAALFGRETWLGSVNPLHHLTPNDAISFTLHLPCPALNPRGAGFAFMKIFNTGLVAAAGKFSDGTKLSFASTLTRSGVAGAIPMFCEPIKGGVFASVLAEQGASPFTYAGSARWIRPPVTKSAFPLGFAEDAAVYVFPFTPAARGVIPVDFGSDQAGVVAIAGVGIPQASGSVTVTGSRLVPSAPLQSFSINRKTGIFSGKIKATTPAGLKSVPFQGAVFQPIQSGEGFFIFKKQPGIVVFEAEPIP